MKIGWQSIVIGFRKGAKAHMILGGEGVYMTRDLTKSNRSQNTSGHLLPNIWRSSSDVPHNKGFIDSL